MDTTQIDAANKVASAINSAAVEPGRQWVARVWEGERGMVRVYLTRSGADRGYLTIDEDGDVTGANAPHIHLAIAALDRAGIASYA